MWKRLFQSFARIGLPRQLPRFASYSKKCLLLGPVLWLSGETKTSWQQRMDKLKGQSKPQRVYHFESNIDSLLTQIRRAAKESDSDFVDSYFLEKTQSVLASLAGKELNELGVILIASCMEDHYLQYLSSNPTLQATAAMCSEMRLEELTRILLSVARAA